MAEVETQMHAPMLQPLCTVRIFCLVGQLSLALRLLGLFFARVTLRTTTTGVSLKLSTASVCTIKALIDPSRIDDSTQLAPALPRYF